MQPIYFNSIFIKKSKKQSRKTMAILKVKELIELETTEQLNQVQLPSFLDQILVYFKIGYYTGIVPFKLKYCNKVGTITLQSTIIRKASNYK